MLAHRLLTEPLCLGSAGYSRLALRLTPLSLGNPLALRAEQAAPPTPTWAAGYINGRKDLQVADGIAFIHACGFLATNLAPYDVACGDTDYAHVEMDLAEVSADDAVLATVLMVDSPGGSAVGSAEAAQAVADAAQIKPVVVFTGSCLASAAYYLAAGASAIVATPSAIVGSIGTISTFRDLSQFWAGMGVKFDLITPAESDLKATWSPFAPMTHEQKAHAIQITGEINAAFTGFVAGHRPQVTAEAMRGQEFTGRQALAAGLIDQLGTLTDAVAAARALAGF